MIPVTKPYLPDRQKLEQYIDGIYERGWLTNNGPLVKELTARLEEYLGVENLLLVANGTLALQVAYRTLGVSGHQYAEKPEAITTPFTFIATASSLAWDGVKPVFVDIDADSWCLDPKNIVSAITANTRAIVPVHVFGNPCDVDFIGDVARHHNLKVIYDASHAFGVNYKGESLLGYGDASTLSFHATKLFHTVEGGAIVFRRKEDLERAKAMINFGITGPESIQELGINAKMNELQAAVGLCVLDEMQENIEGRSRVSNFYRRHLSNLVSFQASNNESSSNESYAPVLLETESQVESIKRELEASGIGARRYFYPSLESFDFLGAGERLPVSTDVAGRILCLPLYCDLDAETQKRIVKIIENEVG
ncbi:DegT/DnrJ/EryC1/StrS family aminotransferase [Alcanivorax sp. IL3]|uniref:DegT/DnrJ/EryC1/StrS family aminotransferase n=1 Tax=unclassified Alcanivorax TaxID=2638842 RepID=UPI0039C14E87